MDCEMVCVWPDGTWCYMDELYGMNHMSDDYQIVPFTSIVQ